MKEGFVSSQVQAGTDNIWVIEEILGNLHWVIPFIHQTAQCKL